MAYEHKIDSDLESAVEFNSGNVDLKQVDSVVAAVYGENDGADWYWVLKMKDGTYGLAVGGCDYSGWDCQSSLSFTGGFKTAEAAAESSVERDSEYEGNRPIRATLLAQLAGSQPFGSIDPT